RYRAHRAPHSFPTRRSSDLTVGEIDFGTAQNVTIGGANVLTLQSSGLNSVLDVGNATVNSGIDVLAAPISVNPASPLAATITGGDRKSTRLNSSHLGISYAV